MTTFRRIAPALGLFLLAPLVAEFLLGNLPISLLPALIALAPLYGGGALLIREVARRLGLRWPGIVLLALAYGVVEEAFATASLFNPNYADLRLLDYGFVPALGMSGPWTLLVLTLHTVFSISAPIAVVELCTRGRRTTPWLGWPGLVVAGVLFGLGAAASAAFNTWPYSPTVGQLAGSAVAVVVLVGAAVLLSRRPARAARAGWVPNPWLVGVLSLGAASAFLGVPGSWPAWAHVVGQLACLAVTAVLVAVWSARTGWDGRHQLGLAGGALLTYAWHAFPETPVVATSKAVDLTGNVIFALGAVLLLILAARRVRAPEPAE